jgi:class 3 adenylate cyclase
MVDLVMRVVNLGVAGDGSPSEVRRIKTINLILVFGILYLGVYTIFYALLDFSGLLPVIVSNSVFILLYGTAMAVNSQGKTEAAMWLLFGASLFNVTLASLLLGSGTGIFLFMAVLPVAGVLISPPNDRTTPLIMMVATVIAFVVVVLVNPSTPDPIAGTGVETMLLVTSVILTVLMLGVVGLFFKRVGDTAEAELLVANERSERLLLNVLPEEIADRLKAGETVIADRAEAVTILFGDLVGSTPLSERLTPDQMVEILNEIFTPFDDLADDLGLEKIKTIGDAYMVVGGLPTPRPDHVEAIAEMALAMRTEISRHSVKGFGPLQMRYGIHTGSVVAGVIGKRKFSYDLWGDTVNTAARMESQGVPGEIQVTEAVYQILQDRYQFASRGPVEIKGKGVMNTFFLSGRKDSP